MGIIRGILDYCFLTAHFYKCSSEGIKKYQLKSIQKLYKHVKKNSGFYKNLYGSVEINKIEDFDKLPVINKKIMLDNFDELNTCGLKLKEATDFAVSKEINKDYTGYYEDKYVVGLSSGTSGSKGIFITPKSLTKRLPFVFLARSGISPRFLPYKILFLLRVFSQGFSDINSPLVKLKYLSTMTPVEAIIDAINKNRINIIMAPPSMLRILLPFADKINAEIETIVTYAEVLTDEDIVIFAKAFNHRKNFVEANNTKVIQIYQASEGQIGSSCKCGNLHINEDLVFVEIYDKYGRLVDSANEIGVKMIITNLVNYVQPLIRYEMNDMIMLGDKCGCGSNFRVIRKVLGRNDDIIYLKNINGMLQHVFPDLFSRWIITGSDDIREFKVIQDNDEITVYVDTLNDSSDKDKLRDLLYDRIIMELKEFAIYNVKLKIIFRKLELPPDMSKYKRFHVSIEISKRISSRED